MAIRTSVWLALAALTLSACAAPPTSPGAALEGRLTASRWTLQSATDAQGQAMNALFPRADPSFTVEFKDGRVGIRGGCNAMGGNYQIDTANQLQVGPMMSTRMACADGLMEADHALGNLLAQRLRIQLVESPTHMLRLVSATGQVLVWAGAPTP